MKYSLIKISKIINLIIFLVIGTSLSIAQENEIKSEQRVSIETIKEIRSKEYKDWQKINLSNLSFYAPKELIPKKPNCYDSNCYTFESKDLFLSIDISSAVGYPISAKKLPGFSEKIIKVDKAFGAIWYFKENEETDPIYKYKSGVLFRFADNSDYKIGISIFSKNEDIKEIAEKMFKSVKFNKHK